MKKNFFKIVLYSVGINAVLVLVYLLFYTFKVEMPDNLAYAQFIAEGDYTFDYMDFFISAGIGLLQKLIRIPTCTQHLILAFKSKKCRKYAFYAGRESIISILKIPNPYNTAQKSH